MVNFLLKLLLSPGIVFLADAFMPGVNYTLSRQIIYTGLAIALFDYILDVLFLKRLGSAVSAVINAVIAAIVVYLSQYLTFSAYITLTGALISGALVGVGEYLTHRLIIDKEMEEARTAS